jgi:hypothetical protein
VAPILIKVGLAPALVAASSLAARRWGPRTGGIVAAFPAIVGPLLLVTALEHGRHAAAHAAGGSVVGLLGLAAFGVGYATVARRHGWVLSLGAAWLAAAAATSAARQWALPLGLVGGTMLTCLSLLLGARIMGRLSVGDARPVSGRPGIASRALIAGLLLAALSTAVGRLGATTGGLLAALPVLASLLAVFTHREAGGGAAVELLRGTLIGMAGFIAFCELVALLIVPDGAPVAFAAATVTALLIQAWLSLGRAAYPAARNSAGRSGEASASASFSPSASRSAA